MQVALSGVSIFHEPGERKFSRLFNACLKMLGTDANFFCSELHCRAIPDHSIPRHTVYFWSPQLSVAYFALT
jgi:hypothetical protein